MSLRTLEAWQSKPSSCLPVPGNACAIDSPLLDMVLGGIPCIESKRRDLWSWTRPSGVSGCRCHSQVSYSTAMSACAKGKAVWDFFGGQVLNNMCQGVGWLWITEINSHANDDQHQMQLFNAIHNIMWMTTNYSLETNWAVVNMLDRIHQTDHCTVWSPFASIRWHVVVGSCYDLSTKYLVLHLFICVKKCRF